MGARRVTAGDLLVAALAALLVLSLAPGASAQGSASGDSGATNATLAVVPISQIGAQSEALTVRLEQVRAERPTLERIEAQLQEFQESIDSATERVEAMLARRYSPAELAAQASRWEELQLSFVALQGRVGKQAGALDNRLSEIADQTEVWRRTLTDARSTRAPVAVVRQVEQALAELASAKKQVADDLASTLVLQNRVREAGSTLRPIFQRIESNRKELATGLLVRQDEPVWRSIPASEAVFAMPGEVGANLLSVWAELVSYASDRHDRMIVHGLFFLLFAWFLWRTRAGRERSHPDRADKASDPLRHPWAGAFLISALMTPFLQSGHVRGLELVGTPLALVAWFRVLAGMLAPALRGPLIGLAMLSLLEVFRLVLIEVPMLDRTLLVLALGAALAGIVWLRRPQRLQHVPWRDLQGSWFQLLDGWMRLLAPTLGAGLIAALLGYTNLADRIAIVAIWGTFLGAAWVALVRVAEAVAEHLIEGSRLGQLRMIQSARPAFLRVLRRGLRAFGLVAWVYVILGSAALWSPTQSAIGTILSASVGYGPVSISLGGVLAFFLTLWISWLLARFTSFALDREVFTRVRTPPGVSFALTTFTRYAILVVGFVIAMGAIGFSMDRVTLLLSALGVGVGFGLQNVVNNFVSGVILLFERPIRIGDRVQLEDLLGVVTRIGIRASSVRTFDGSDVIVPNGDFISARLINWTLSDEKRRVIVPIGVAYGTDPERVLEILSGVAHEHPEVLDDPPPEPLFRGFGDSSLDFELRAWTESPRGWLSIQSDLAVGINRALGEAGITIPFPQRDLHLRNIPELRDALEEVVRPPRDDPSA
jgi:small-conductance mechanosensitive channel